MPPILGLWPGSGPVCHVVFKGRDFHQPVMTGPDATDGAGTQQPPQVGIRYARMSTGLFGSHISRNHGYMIHDIMCIGQSIWVPPELVKGVSG
jgi:hypothetical protein